jgi:large repetitive protein
MFAVPFKCVNKISAGNLSAINQSVKDWLIDKTQPSLLLNSVGGDDVINLQERNDGVLISGTATGAQEGDDVMITFNGLTLHTMVSSMGQWTLKLDTPQIPVGENSQNLTVVVTDTAGNVSSEMTKAIRIDTIAPTLTLPTDTMPTDLTGWSLNVIGAKVDNVLNLFELNAIQLSTTDWSLSGTTSAEAGQTLEFILNSHSFTGIVTEVLDGPNVWTVTQSTNNDVEAVLSGLVHGNSYDMTVRVRDAAGNAAEPVTASLLVKLYPPDIPTIQLLQTNTYTPTITGTALKEVGVDDNGDKDYGPLEDTDVLTVTVAGQSFTLTLAPNFSSDGPLSYDRTSNQWSLNLASNLDKQGQLIKLITSDCVLDVGVTVKSVGYDLLEDKSKSEVTLKKALPVLTFEIVETDNQVNAIELADGVLLKGTVIDTKPGDTLNMASNRAMTLKLGTTKTWNLQNQQQW